MDTRRESILRRGRLTGTVRWCDDRHVSEGRSAEDPGNTGGQDPEQSSQRRSDDARYFQQNLASRLFPGPSRPNSPEFDAHIKRLLRYSGEVQPGRGRQARNRNGDAAQAALRDPQSPLAAATPQNLATTEDLDRVRETLETQNELLQAILQSSVDTQTDARSTAQNSRTFAWAGTAIALLTLVATVISVLAAIRAN